MSYFEQLATVYKQKILTGEHFGTISKPNVIHDPNKLFD